MSHLKRLNAPKTWAIKRKGIKYILKSNPGPHSLKASIPISLVFRELMDYAANLKEVKNILHNKTVLVDGVRRKEPKFPVGLFDVIEIKETKEAYRIVFENKRFGIVKVDVKEANSKLVKITDKTKVGKKTQLNFNDGSNLLVEKDVYKTNESLVIEFGKTKKIKEHVKFEKGNMIYLIGGKHIGTTAKLESIKGDKIQFKGKEGVFETLKKYAFIIGTKKPALTLNND